MRTIEEIKKFKDDLIKQQKCLEEEHKKLNQIDMLSGEGARLREKINELKGEINGLNWVIR